MKQSVSGIVVSLGLGLVMIQGCASVNQVNGSSMRAAPNSGSQPKSAMVESVSDDEIKKAFMTTLAGMRAEFAKADPAPAAPLPSSVPSVSIAPAISGPAPLPGMSPITERNIGPETKVASAAGSIPVFTPGDTPSSNIEVRGDSTRGLSPGTCQLASLAPMPAPEVPVVPVTPEAPPVQPKKTLLSAKTLEASLKKTGYTVSFADDESRIYSASSLGIEYSDPEDLAKEIEARTDLFCSAVDGTLILSAIKEKTYSVAPFEKFMAKNVGDFLHNPKAEARIIDGLGQMIVKDDRIGHQKVNDTLEQMKAETFASYRFKVEVEKVGTFSKGSMELASSGQVTPATSPMAVGDWMVGVKKQGERLFVEVMNAKTMDHPATFIMDGERGGNANFQAKQGDKDQRVTVSITK